MSLKSFTTLAGLAVTGFAAVVLALFRAYMEGPPLWAIALGCVGVVVLAAWWWHGELGRGASYVEFSSAARLAMARTITFAVLVHCVWLVWTLADLDAWPAHALRLAGLALVEWVVAVAWDYRLTHLLPRSPGQEVEIYRPTPTLLVNDKPELQSADEVMQNVLARGGWPYVLVTKYWQLPDGHKGATFECRALSEQTVSELLGKDVTSVKAIGPGDEEKLALAAEEEMRIELETNWVRIQATKRPGRVLVTVALEDIMAKALPYELVTTLADPDEPFKLGSQIHGDPATIEFGKKHGVICGPTGSGKTGVVNVMIAEGTRRRGRVYVCAVEKGYDLVGQWYDCHLGTDNDLPFQTVVGIDDVLQLLAEFYYEARRRQNLPHHERGNFEPWTLFIEEAPAVLTNNDRVIEIEGRRYNASALVAHCKRTVLASDMTIWELSQEFDNAMFGDSAASIKGNSGIKILTRSQSGDERSRAFGKGGAAMRDLDWPGEMYIKDIGDPYAAKSQYINEMHGNKKRLHEGVDIATVSLQRSTLVSLRASGPLSPWMAALPTRMTPEYRDYLQGRRSLPTSNNSTISLPAIVAVDAAALADQAIAELEAQLDLRDQAMLHVVDNESKPGPRQQIADLVTEAGREMTRSEILAALDDVSESSIDNHLSKLVQQGRLCRPSAGVYAPAEAA